MNWIQYIEQLDLADDDYSYDFNLPASDRVLQNLKAQFKLNELPGELEELYKQSNGISEKLRGRTIGEAIWSVEEVIKQNIEFRSLTAFRQLYMSFDQLLFIGGIGNGDLYGYRVLYGNFNASDIYLWNHENDNRTCIVPDLASFIVWRTNPLLSEGL